MVTVASIRARFPEVSEIVAYPDARIQVFIGDSALFIGACFGGYSDLAQSFLAMHLLTLAESTSGSIESSEGGALGAVTSEAVDKVSYSRGINAIDQNHPDAGYLSTTYGQQFLQVRRTACAGGMMVV